jgi:hypothetical protein
MSLPKIESPTFSTKLPSGKDLKFRPFSVKEQKALLITAEGGDEKSIYTAIKDLVDSCTFGKLDWDKQPMVDLEWAFLNIRSKSVGEVVEMSFKCLATNESGIKCEAKNEVSVDVREATWEPFPNEVVEITPSIKIVLSPLTVSDIVSQNDELYSKTKMILDGDTTVTEFTKEEFKEFEDSIPPLAMVEIQKYFLNQPTLVLKIKTKCLKCGNEGEIVLKGVLNFFG